jgi:hypothetical protein
LFLDKSRRISASDIDNAPVQKNRVSAIGNYAVVLEDSSIWFFHVVSSRQAAPGRNGPTKSEKRSGLKSARQKLAPIGSMLVIHDESNIAHPEQVSQGAGNL